MYVAFNKKVVFLLKRKRIHTLSDTFRQADIRTDKHTHTLAHMHSVVRGGGGILGRLPAGLV